MKYSPGDIADRLSILTLKVDRESKLYQKEYELFLEAYQEYNKTQKIFEKLLNINSLIWDLESDIRNRREDTLGLEEVGRRAIKIRNLNEQRILYKNEINLKFKEGFQEKKL